ncbi:MAG: hypothetical protein J0H69_09050 [Burkholderiales bacterium]|nr:hypothetical protein [Burkholderiales bacterium]
MTNQIESPDGKPRKDERPSPDTRGVADGATGKTADNRTPDGSPPRHPEPVTPTRGQPMAD